MLRKIVGFCQDERQDWIARIDCGHRQHMHHKPPLISRPWVVTEQGREGRVGMDIECPLCDRDRAEMPANYTEYRRTPIFDEVSVPSALLGSHRTKLGVWGMLCVVHGDIDYVVLEPERHVTTLHEGSEQVIVTALPHMVVLHEGARFFVAFYKPSSDNGDV